MRMRALVPMDFYRNKMPGLRSVMLEVNRLVYLEGGTVHEESVRDVGKIIKYIANESRGL